MLVCNCTERGSLLASIWGYKLEKMDELLRKVVLGFASVAGERGHRAVKLLSGLKKSWLRGSGSGSGCGDSTLNKP